MTADASAERNQSIFLPHTLFIHLVAHYTLSVETKKKKKKRTHAVYNLHYTSAKKSLEFVGAQRPRVAVYKTTQCTLETKACIVASRCIPKRVAERGSAVYTSRRAFALYSLLLLLRRESSSSLSLFLYTYTLPLFALTTTCIRERDFESLGIIKALKLPPGVYGDIER